MQPSEPQETAAAIEAQAAQWAAQADRGPLSDAGRRELETWAAADPRRAGAYARALAINLHLDRVVALGEDLLVAPPLRPAATRRHVMAFAGGAAFLGAASLGSYALFRRRAGEGAISTAKGAVRQVTLADGSRITLNSMTRIVPDLSATMRTIELLEGEALFDVTRDHHRPFIVQAGDFALRADGSSFSLRHAAADAIRVVVRQGMVEVSRKDTVLGQIHAGIALQAGKGGTSIETLAPAQIEQALGWNSLKR